MKNKNNDLDDDRILRGFRKYDSEITKKYFYGYCRMAYHIYNKRYGLDHKFGMDFYSLAHEYYIYLDKHSWKPLEDKSPNVSLRTWMTNGFRFLILDKLKENKLDDGQMTMWERADNLELSFDIVDLDYRKEVDDLIEDICTNLLGEDTTKAKILRLMLSEGLKGKEVAKLLGITPSAVSQMYNKLLKNVVTPYFKRYYEIPMQKIEESAPKVLYKLLSDKPGLLYDRCNLCMPPTFDMNEKFMDSKRENRITPRRITKLEKGEIFVFGSNLAGMHGGGAARTAHDKFGAVWGQGEGLQGQSYAIPTMQGGVETIKPYVDEFIEFARHNKNLKFLVTAIGCGIAGFSPDEIAPLFRKAVGVENISLPDFFWDILQPNY